MNEMRWVTLFTIPAQKKRDVWYSDGHTNTLHRSNIHTCKKKTNNTRLCAGIFFRLRRLINSR